MHYVYKMLIESRLECQAEPERPPYLYIYVLYYIYIDGEFKKVLRAVVMFWYAQES